MCLGNLSLIERSFKKSFTQCWALWVKNRNFYLRFMEFWRAILDVSSRRLSEAKPAEEGGCATSLITKYEPLPVVSDRVISA